MTEPARRPAWRGTVRPLAGGRAGRGGLALLGVALLTVVTAPAAVPILGRGALPRPPSRRRRRHSSAATFSLALGPDGIDGLAPLGLDEAHAVTMLTTAFGPPNEDISFPCADPAGEMRSVRWADLTAFFMDSQFVGYLDGLHYPNDGHPLELTTPEGVGIGSSREELLAAYGDRLEVGPPPDDVQGDVEEYRIDDGQLSGLIEGEGEAGVVITIRAGLACFPESP